MIDYDPNYEYCHPCMERFQNQLSPSYGSFSFIMHRSSAPLGALLIPVHTLHCVGEIFRSYTIYCVGILAGYRVTSTWAGDFRLDRPRRGSKACDTASCWCCNIYCSDCMIRLCILYCVSTTVSQPHRMQACCAFRYGVSKLYIYGYILTKKSSKELHSYNIQAFIILDILHCKYSILWH